MQAPSAAPGSLNAVSVERGLTQGLAGPTLLSLSRNLRNGSWPAVCWVEGRTRKGEEDEKLVKCGQV